MNVNIFSCGRKSRDGITFRRRRAPKAEIWLILWKLRWQALSSAHTWHKKQIKWTRYKNCNGSIYFCKFFMKQKLYVIISLPVWFNRLTKARCWIDKLHIPEESRPIIRTDGVIDHALCRKCTRTSVRRGTTPPSDEDEAQIRRRRTWARSQQLIT